MTQNVFNGEVIDLTREGEGIVKIDRQVFFIPGVTLGDKIEFKLQGKRGNISYGELLYLKEPSPQKRNPPCPHFGKCGGCQILNLEYSAQLKFKENLVKNALSRVGGLKELAIGQLSGSPNEFYYRNRVQVPCGLENEKFICGYYQINSHKIVDQTQCQLHPVEFSTIINKLKLFFNNEPAGQKAVRHIVIRKSEYEKKSLLGLVVKTKKIDFIDRLIKAIENINQELPDFKINSLVLNHNPEETSEIFGRNNKTFWGPGSLTEKIGEDFFKISLNSFQQVNNPQAVAAYQKICALLPKNTKKIIDLYCGIGTITLAAAKYGEQILGIENNPMAINDARSNAEFNKVHNCQFMKGSVDNIDLDILKQAEVIIADPPRRGLEPQLLKNLLEVLPEKIIYLSCDPATLARDLKHLTAKHYRIKEIQPYDFFPQTTHVETLVSLERP
jgi:23S rRNA (uracil1939-C5)-methyltransferase